MKNKDQEMLDVVDDNDNIIGLETRVRVHQEGLLHREIHIWFFTPQGEIIFQHRAKDKDTYPDKLDATVGGHVDPGMSYEETAVKECKEETGVDINFDDLLFLTKMSKRTVDEDTGLINNTIRSQYAYLYRDSIDELEVEKGKAIGFEKWKIESLSELEDKDRDRFIPLILEDKFINLFNEAKRLLSI